MGKGRSFYRKIGALLLVYLLSCLVFLLWKRTGNWQFLLEFRAQKILMMSVVGTSIGISTILFQTLSHNRLLTPSIIGLDRLYLLLQMAVIFFLGPSLRMQLPAVGRFAIEVVMMMLAGFTLFAGIFQRISHDIYRILLIGVIFATLCSSLVDLMGRMIDPVEYAYFQGVRFAQFNRTPELALLIAGSVLMMITWGIIWHKRYVIDVLALGQKTAIGLGVNYGREVRLLMLLVALLVALSTALVGPVMFFGLLVSALTYHFFATPHHGTLFIAASLLASIILILGQAVFERGFNYASSLSVVIEGVGGLLFLYFLLRKKR